MDDGFRVLIVEDDIQLATSLADELRALGHVTKAVHDGREALTAVSLDQYDAAIVDRMLPQLDGIAVIERLREQGITIPVIMLTALGRLPEKVEGLGAGADDYVVKPVTPAELDARLRALLRGRQWTTGEAETLRAGDIVVSPTKLRAWRAGKVVDLPKVEFDLLAELARNVDTVMTRTMLIERVWGYDFDPKTNVVDSYIRRLRVRLMADGGSDPIDTVRGVGYALRS